MKRILDKPGVKSARLISHHRNLVNIWLNYGETIVNKFSNCRMAICFVPKKNRTPLRHKNMRDPRAIAILRPIAI